MRSAASLVDPAIGEAGDVDTAAVHMQTASGKICVITNSRRATYGHDQRIEVHGSKGMLRAGNVHLTTVEMRRCRRLHRGPDPVLLHRALRRRLPARGGGVPDCGGEGPAPRASGHDGLMAQKLADAAAEC